ncbi:MAG: sigma-E processing peptidase SpoIIGA [Clostridium sp.]|nr:sigma-E processing peptidase SpoIIGA [Clostridium sp.]MCM1547256.1 sigma-E processing peptidase SpoIIGA [Ruminococcus sp.]
MTIYIDVLIILNLYVNFFLLKATARLTHTPLKTARCVISSVIGSLFSLCIFLPKMNFIVQLLIKLAASAAITSSCFGIRDIIRTAKLMLCFYVVNFIFGGIIMLFYFTFKPEAMAVGNTYFYIDFSLLSLAVFTAISYFAVTMFRKLLDRGRDTDRKYTVKIRKNGISVSVPAISDTGNSLVDMFTGKPVIICRQTELYDIIGDCGAEKLLLKASARLIPYSTIGNSGMIAVFDPDEVIICDIETGREKRVDAVIGVNPKDVPAIFNPKLIF